MAKNMIIMNRGDSAELNLFIDDEYSSDGLYLLDSHDAVFLGVMMPNMSFEDAIIKKKYVLYDQREDKSILIRLSPADTLDLAPGIYYYAIKLVKNVGTEHEEVKTIINKTKFVLND